MDLGSRAVKMVLFEEGMLREEKVIETAWFYKKCGVHTQQGFTVDFDAVLSQRPTAMTVTGYGRNSLNIVGSEIISELKAHMLGALWQTGLEDFTLLDLGGQDSKVIRLDENGAVANFVMNDKCAAGTGRFLEMMARTMEMNLDQMSECGLEFKEDITISSMCTVFAESEVVSLIAQNKATDDIVHGLNKAVAVKTAALTRRVGGEEKYMMTGGVSKNKGLVKTLEEKLGTKLVISDKAQLCGALGAALFAADMADV